MSDKRKQSLYFPEEMLIEIQKEAARLDRSLSWIVQQAWRMARNEIQRFPSVNDIVEENRSQTQAANTQAGPQGVVGGISHTGS